MNGSGVGNKGEKRSFLDSTLLPCQSTGRRSLSTLELECLSFTHQTICFIRFIFSPSDSAQPDRALMMKRRGHPCIISESACTKVLVCARLCASLQQCNFRRARCWDGDAHSPPSSHHLSPSEDWCLSKHTLLFVAAPRSHHAILAYKKQCSLWTWDMCVHTQQLM